MAHDLKVSEATGLALDWMVERAKGTHWSGNGYFIFRYEGCGPNGFISPHPQWKYSTDWSQGGPIIEREKIDIEHDFCSHEVVARKYLTDEYAEQWGPTPLIAAMRCYVASKLGDIVKVPKEMILDAADNGSFYHGR